jgi:RNA recognition motif-containing protein
MSHIQGYRVKVADLNTRVTKYELEKEFDRYGRVLDLILIRRCPTVCFIVYKNQKDARYAAKKLHNCSIWNTRLRAELAKPSGKSSRYQRYQIMTHHYSYDDVIILR